MNLTRIKNEIYFFKDFLSELKTIFYYYYFKN